ncbi:HalOD1 output domain-containing protein [Halobaculum marinum]|uniref:HalOD1 output domain-containing protein n=1 Tax=Halobaculum marinum TaxID=3031996 RepID=A0ABD5X051_9EURY|nr:HalOD1 output domain-containing protein [Halobaculum sp. DT55]
MSGDPWEEVSIEHDPDTGEYTATFDPREIDASIAVIETTAAIRREAPNRHAPLFEVVDPDALDQICSSHSDDTLVEFTYLDHRIRVLSEGRITVVPVEAE